MQALTVGTNTFLTGLGTLIAAPVFAIIDRSWEVLGGVGLCGFLLTGVGYALMRADA